LEKFEKNMKKIMGNTKKRREDASAIAETLCPRLPRQRQRK